MLYLVGTPIGNLEDITLRALKVLKECDYILCEDTRRTKILLKHYEISAKLISFHRFNEKRREDQTISDLKKGLNIALVSDAGMPTISDPGCEIIKRCHLEEIEVTCIPGPSALLTALTLSGLDGTHFQFLGFMPKSPSKVRKAIASAAAYPGTTIFFESPHKILKHMQYYPEEAHLVVLREMTKIHEEILSGTPIELEEHFTKKSPRGEFVVLFRGEGK